MPPKRLDIIARHACVAQLNTLEETDIGYRASGIGIGQMIYRIRHRRK